MADSDDDDEIFDPPPIVSWESDPEDEVLAPPCPAAPPAEAVVGAHPRPAPRRGVFAAWLFWPAAASSSAAASSDRLPEDAVDETYSVGALAQIEWIFEAAADFQADVGPVVVGRVPPWGRVLYQIVTCEAFRPICVSAHLVRGPAASLELERLCGGLAVESDWFTR